MLVDSQIRAALNTEDIVVVPNDNVESCIQPASLDVHLGHQFASLCHPAHLPIIDVKTDTRKHWKHTVVNSGESFTVEPGQLVLASTLERIQLSPHIVARVEGKSSLGRLGLLVHATAGYIDPGWPLATITLEISTVHNIPVRIYPGMPIAQLAFARTTEPAHVYAGKYVGQSGPTPSRFHENWTGEAWL